MSIRRIVQLVLDPTSARKVEQDTKEALDRGTDPRKANENLDSVGGALKKLAVLAAKVWVVRKVVDYGKAVFQVGASVRAVQSQFNTVFGESRDTVSSFLGDFRKLAGLTRREAQEIAAGTGSMAQGFGMSADASAQFSEEVLKLSGDLASFNDVPTAQAARLVQSALIGNTEAARSLKINFTALDVEQRALAQTGKDNAKSLTQAEKAMAALSVITERAGPQLGDLARTANDADNQAKQLSGAWVQLKETLAAALVGGTDGLTVFGDLRDVLEELSGWVEANSRDISAWSRTTIVALMAAFETIRFVVRSLFNLGQVIGSTLELGFVHVRQRIAPLLNGIIEALDKIPGVEIDYRMNQLTPEEFGAEQERLFGQIRRDAGDAEDALIDLGEAYHKVGQRAREALAGGDEVESGPSLDPSAAADGAENGGAGGRSLGGPTFGDRSFIPQLEGLFGEIAQTYGENLQRIEDQVDAADPLGGLIEQTETTAAFMREGFKGVGEAIVGDLISGRADEQFAQGMAALGSGLWPSNPQALLAAGKHFAAAAAFRALGSRLGGGGGGFSGGSVGPGRIATSLPGTREIAVPDLNIYIDPLSPADDRFQRVVFGAQQNAQERFGERVQVNIRPRTVA